MSYTISCYTLFDITQTNVLNRHRPDMDKEWLHKRNTQSNFDTIQQAISLRSQPEIVRTPERIQILLGYIHEIKTFISKEYENELIISLSSFLNCMDISTKNIINNI